MLNFEKELESFDFSKVDPEFSGHFSEIAPLIEALSGTVKRIGKDINQSSLQVEELLSAFDDLQEKDRLLTERQAALDISEKEKENLILGMINILDQVENLYRYTRHNDCGSWSEQIEILWKKTAVELMTVGLVIIEGENSPFDARLHEAVQVTEDRRYRNETVLVVFRCGYQYRSKLLRKARVMVNKLERRFYDGHRQ